MAELTEIRETVRERYAARRDGAAKTGGPRLLRSCRLPTAGRVRRGASTSEAEALPRSPPSTRPSDAACPPPSPICTRARPSSTSARAPAPMY